MPKETFLFIAAIIGAMIAYITAKMTIRSQLNIAKLNAHKDVTLQRDRPDAESRKNEGSIECEKGLKSCIAHCQKLRSKILKR